MEENNFSKAKKSRGAFFLWTVAILLIFIFSYALWRFLQRPAVGTVKMGVLSPSVESFDQKNEQKRFVGKYISFSYNSTYEKKTDDTPVNGPVKESIFLSAPDWEGKKIAVTVEERGESALDSSPSYKMRREASKIYHETPIAMGIFTGSIFEKKSQVFEVTAFLINQSEVITISLTSPIKFDGLAEELEALLKSARTP